VSLRFEWDSAKATQNRTVHGVTFEEAATVFGDPLAVEILDQGHSISEERFLAIGRSSRGRLLVVVHLETLAIIRIISARLATRLERESYEEA